MNITTLLTGIVCCASVFVVCVLHRPLELAGNVPHNRSHNEYGMLPKPRPRPHVPTTTEDPYATLGKFRLKGRPGGSSLRPHPKKPDLPPGHPNHCDTRL